MLKQVAKRSRLQEQKNNTWKVTKIIIVRLIKINIKYKRLFLN